MAEAAPQVVFIPGLLCDAQLWQPQIEALAGRIQPWVADVTRDRTMAAMAATVLREAPFERFALAGLSMGGYVSLELMRQAPRRVTRLALLDTQARGDTSEAAERRRALMDFAERGKFAGVTDRLMPMLLHATRLGDPRLTGIVKAMAQGVGKDGFLRQQTAILERIDSRPHLSAIGCPTLVLCGREDALTPLDRHEEMAQGIAGAVLTVIPDCGHLSTLEKPADVVRALESWLAR